MTPRFLSEAGRLPAAGAVALWSRAGAKSISNLNTDKENVFFPPRLLLSSMNQFVGGGKGCSIKTWVRKRAAENKVKGHHFWWNATCEFMQNSLEFLSSRWATEWTKTHEQKPLYCYLLQSSTALSVWEAWRAATTHSGVKAKDISGLSPSDVEEWNRRRV